MSFLDKVPNEKDLQRLATLYAKVTRWLFNALVKEGFTKQEALEIILKGETMFKFST